MNKSGESSTHWDLCHFRTEHLNSTDRTSVPPSVSGPDTRVMTREEDTYAMLDTRDWTRVSPRVNSELGLKSLDNDWHTVLMHHLSAS